MSETGVALRRHLRMECQMDIAFLATTYERDGYIGGVPVLTPKAAADHRASMEASVSRIGSQLYKSMAHTIQTAPLKLATD